MATLQGKSIKQYALDRLFPGGADDELAWQELKALLTVRINEGLKGKVSAKSIGDILDEELALEAEPAHSPPCFGLVTIPHRLFEPFTLEPTWITT